MVHLIDVFPSEKAVMVNCANSSVRILFSDILYIECAQRKICFVLTSGESIFTKQIRSSFFSQLAPLLQDARFACPHQSFFVNLSYVRKVFTAELVMENGQMIPVSKKRHKQLAAQYQHFAAAADASPAGDLTAELLKSFHLPLVIFRWHTENDLIGLWYANGPAAELYGLSVAQLYQQYGADITGSVHPDDLACLRLFLANATCGRECVLSYRLRHKDGYRTVQLLVKRREEPSGQKIDGLYFPL